jgi:hypothetical protein
MKYIIIYLLLNILVYVTYKSNEKFSNRYNNLTQNWNKIFPDGNRNAAGAKFYKYILDLDLSYEEFLEYNKLYCPVSGSLVSEGSKPDFIKMKELGKNQMYCGYYYRCCWPCSCDIMKYAKIVKHKYKSKEIYMIVIKNPCIKKNFPEEVNKKYLCEDNNLDEDQVITYNNHLVIGLLQDVKKCDDNDIKNIDNDEITGKECKKRNNLPLDKLYSGMGDIFIKLAS